MAPGSQAAADDTVARSGGKILKTRRTAARKTPYDRPASFQPQPQPQQAENPSWLTGLVSPAKFVAGGAGKILSSFWNPKSWSAPSSSSSDSDSESEDDSGDDENPSEGAIELNQQKGSSSQKSQILHLVEQLLMLEQYSREECDRLIEIINSRVVDYSMRDSVDAGPSMIHSLTYDEALDNRSQAILEAKKWVADNKVKTSSRSELDNGISAFKSVMASQATEGEAGSPVDVAKSYMRARPPWASPIDYNNSLSPSPLAADLFKDTTLYSSGGGISFPSAKRDHLSAGSWNIQDEIRRLRSKATEDMLSSNQSMKLASSALDHATPKYSSAIDKSISIVERDELVILEAPKSVDEIVNLAAEGGTPGISDTRNAQTDLPTEALPSHPKMPALEQYQGMESKEEKMGEGKKLENEESNDIDKNCHLMTESPDIPPVDVDVNVNDSPNAKADGTTEKRADGTTEKRADGTTEKRAVTRASKQSRRGKTRG